MHILASIQVAEAIIADFDVEAAIGQAEEAVLAREVDERKISDDKDDLPLQDESPLSYFDGSTKAPEVIAALADVDTLQHGNSGYQVGNIHVGPWEKHEYTFEDPDIQKMCYIRWDGRTMTPITNGDHDDAIILTVLVGHPKQGWDEVVNGASVALEEALSNTGISHGGGCKAPRNISISGGQDNAVKAYL
ncbi:hypothetical protein NEOLEDRAFT_1184858 [Neolentinus lepideus HHB14362 ss-1]|uniref:Uncharacterized protein n=1 Tax=Neolentinus lepideus HHB14362 ss-1 TaxID=1314782 RepID=A0A165LEE0_9AGAM|nr:hypothetical protein NEOLEDRAFT_1184858 [Neolentinus lepideus HHB14362 ss-1]